jgi:anti-sigma B factor antagonist
MSGDRAGLQHSVERERSGDGEVPVLVIEGDFDLPEVETYLEAVDEALAGDSEALIVDTTGLRFIDSSGLNALARTGGSPDERSIEVAIVVTPDTTVDRVLEISGLGDLLPTAPDRPGALALVGGGS